MNESIDYLKQMYEIQDYNGYMSKNIRAKIERELELQYQMEKIRSDIYTISNIKPYKIPEYSKTADVFHIIYKKEMPKGGYFEGCTLELVTLNKNLI